MKKSFHIAILAAMLCGNNLCAQDGFKWFDPQKADMQVVEGQAFPNECKGVYQRFPDSRKASIPSWVWGNSIHSAGLTMHFRTNASQIQVRYTTTSRNYAMPHMPSTGVSGLDLYATDSKGCSLLCHGWYSFKDTITYNYNGLTYHDDAYTYELFLPLYNGVKWLEVGVPADAEFTFVEASKEKPIVVYGTSIAHGGCASRPAMAWTAMVKRELDIPVINWGFSGSGRLDPEMFNMMCEMDARLFVIDCIPNMDGDKDHIVSRMTDGIKKLRTSSNVPILIVEHDGYADQYISEGSCNRYQLANEECRKAYEQLRADGVKNLWYLSYDEIGMNPDGMVDCVHATDLGMTDYAKAYTKKIRRILRKQR